MNKQMSSEIDVQQGQENCKPVNSLSEVLKLAPRIEVTTFEVRWKQHAPFTVKIDMMKMTIGRSSMCDIHISDPFVSRFHADLKRERGQVLLIDAGSANGTFLNGQQVRAPMPLQPGDLIRIGETEIRVQHRE